MIGGQRNERLLLLAMLGALALNYPLLSLFADTLLVLGIPLLYLYLFGVWIGLIALAGIVIEGKAGSAQRESGASEHEGRDA